MSDEVVVIRSNIADFNLALRRMSSELRTKSVRASASAASGVIKSALVAAAKRPHSAKADQSKRTGMLARAVFRYRMTRRTTRGAEWFMVGIRTGKRFVRKRDGAMIAKPDAYYFKWLEQGWIPRGPWQRRRRRRLNDREREAEMTSPRRVSFPFLSDAFVASNTQALATFERTMDEEIRRIGVANK